MRGAASPAPPRTRLIGPVRSPGATPPAPASGSPAAPARHLHICARAADWPALGGAAVTAAAPAGAPAAPGDPGGRIPSAAPLPSGPGPTWGGGRREAGSSPRSNMAPPRRRPNRRSACSRSSGRPRGGEAWGPGALWPERGAVQWPGLPSPPRRGRHVRPRPRGGLSPARGPAATSGPAGTPRPRADQRRGRRRGHRHAGHLISASRGPARSHEGVQARASVFKWPWIRPHVLLSFGDPGDTRLAVKSGARGVPPQGCGDRSRCQALAVQKAPG